MGKKMGRPTRSKDGSKSIIVSFVITKTEESRILALAMEGESVHKAARRLLLTSLDDETKK